MHATGEIIAMPNKVADRHALYQFHRKEPTFLVRHQLLQGRNVGMRDVGQVQELLFEAIDTFRRWRADGF